MKIEDLIKELHTYLNGGAHHSSQFIFIEGVNPQFISSYINFISLFLSKKDRILTSQLENGDYKRFSAFEILVKELLPLNLEHGKILLKEYEKYLSRVLPRLYGITKASDFTIADTIILAVVRRISRESHHSALLIDKASSFFLEFLERTLAKDERMAIFLPHFDFWDRPSLRVINRINKVNRNINIRWVAFTRYCSDSLKPTVDEFANKIISAHLDFVEKFKQIQPNVKRFQLDGRETIKLPQAALNEADINLNEMAIELAFQNYERVYHIARLAINKSHQKEKKSQILRLIALADASRGDYKEAYKQLESAFKQTQQNNFKAHLKYLQGLIYTKRFYDLEMANRHYDEGLEILKNTNETNNPVYAIERAWLLNGKALIHALRAKSLSNEKKEHEIPKSFNLQIEAFNLVKKGSSPNLSYLRFNLLANITFLLEIDKKYNEAVTFWTKAFERYLAKNNPSFELAFKTRLGLLQYKAGKQNEAIDSLRIAHHACSKLEDPFYEQRIAYTYGYVLFNSKKYKEALEYFTKGIRITFRTKEWNDFAEHLKGLLLIAVAIENKRLIKIICEIATLNKNLGGQAYEILLNSDSFSKIKRYLQARNIKLREPEPKLSSYIPSVDLEGTPEKDLNRYLVSSETTDVGNA